jgi:putative flippase GtrA
MSARRAAAFAIVGLMGFVLQLAVLASLTWFAGWPYLPATVAAVEASVVHNFVWHERWTWSDRRTDADPVIARFARFNLTTGLTSIAGNVALMAVLVHGLGIGPIAANALTVTTLAVVNFLISDSWVFAARAVAVVAVLCAAVPASAAGPRPDTIAAWDAYVKAAEARIDGSAGCGRSNPPDLHGEAVLHGEVVHVVGGAIHRWLGAVVVRGITVDTVIERLLDPGTPPPQEDVVESRVLARPASNALHVYLKIARRTLVTAVYDTEHDVTVTRLSPALARSRSVATQITEIGGDDRGFLWRLNSYWRYQQTADGVLVEMESLTLSRDVPAVLRPIAMPIVSRIARESVRKTLDAFRSWFEPLSGPFHNYCEMGH